MNVFNVIVITTYIFSVNRYSFNTYCFPGTIPVTGATSMKKMNILALMELAF